VSTAFGAPGKKREIAINGAAVHPKGRYVLQPGDRLTTIEAGGGGYGDPKARRVEALRADLAQGCITPEGLLRDYGRHLEEVEGQ
jgi:N-methylhydantoinase B